jgi:multiple RNA-binding domain-containing protein 1
MDPKRASKKLREDGVVASDIEMAAPPVEDESDGEYEEIPAKGSQTVARDAPLAVNDAGVPLVPGPAAPQRETLPDVSVPDVVQDAPPQPPIGATDDDWLRSRTNRLLDLVDPDDPNFATRTTTHSGPATVASLQIPVAAGPSTEEGPDVQDTNVDDHSAAPAELGDGDSTETLIQKTARLFLRNLPYTASEDSLRTRFEKFGAIEEVCKQRHCVFPSLCCSGGLALHLVNMMNP